MWVFVYVAEKGEKKHIRPFFNQKNQDIEVGHLNELIKELLALFFCLDSITFTC